MKPELESESESALELESESVKICATLTPLCAFTCVQFILFKGCDQIRVVDFFYKKIYIHHVFYLNRIYLI